MFDRYSRIGILASHMLALLGRGLYTEARILPHRVSLYIRHIDGGSSNLPEMELISLSNPLYELDQYGIEFMSSPRHADLLLITGPVTRNMAGPVMEAFRVMPEPKRIITVGRFADLAGHSEVETDGDLFTDSYAIVDSIDALVDAAILPAKLTIEMKEEMKKAILAHIPGSPPSPRVIIETLLRESANWPENRSPMQRLAHVLRPLLGRGNQERHGR
jgi:Ni,Fe-hydrogenase III small subunit